MKTLREMTMAQFVELLCGDTSVMRAAKLTPKQAESARTRIIYEFTELSDPSGAKSYLTQRTQALKRHGVMRLMQICRNLCEIKADAEARQLLEEWGERGAPADAEALKMWLDAYIARTKRDIDVEDAPEAQKPLAPEEIRKGYDRQCASLMAYFRFQIDMGTISAAQFACLIEQAVRESRAQKAAMSKGR